MIIHSGSSNHTPTNASVRRSARICLSSLNSGGRLLVVASDSARNRRQ